MDRPFAFWETSALVPLCTRQPASLAVHALYQQYAISVWWATPVDIASALAKLLRMKVIGAPEAAIAREIAQTLEVSWSVNVPSDFLRSRASDLVTRHDLRAADALQLSAALQWCENIPAARIFLTTDDKLREAARHAGFETSRL